VLGWEGVPEPWRQALALAWEAYADDTVPIGAVITDADGRIVSGGRNRIHADGEAPPPFGLAGSRLAHAEVNAMLGLPLGPTARFDDYTIFTTTEPCLLCAGAVSMVRVGSVYYAAADPVAGSVDALSGDNPYLRRRSTNVVGPRHDMVGAVSRLLTEDWSWRVQPGGLVEEVCRELQPDLAAVVEGLVASDLLPKLSASAAPLADAVHALAPSVERVIPLLG
jgi:tRNA(adenine34) deaminase